MSHDHAPNRPAVVETTTKLADGTGTIDRGTRGTVLGVRGERIAVRTEAGELLTVPARAVKPSSRS